MQLAKQLVTARKNKRLSQRAAAAKVGISAVYLCYLEKGQNEPSLRIMKRLAKVYGLGWADVAANWTK
jgi:transcriptional regulator with XRE-family HTH domain